GVQRKSYECSFMAGGELIAIDLPLVGIDAHEMRLLSVLQEWDAASNPRVAQNHRRDADGLGHDAIERIQQCVDIVSVDSLDVPPARRPLIGDWFGAQYSNGWTIGLQRVDVDHRD